MGHVDDDDDAGTALSRKEIKKLRSDSEMRAGGGGKKRKVGEFAKGGRVGDVAEGGGSSGAAARHLKVTEHVSPVENDQKSSVKGWKSTKKVQGDGSSSAKATHPGRSLNHGVQDGGHGSSEQPGDETPAAPKADFAGTEREILVQQRAELPISKARKEILWTLKRSDTLVLVGETGSGKTTQLPQFIKEAGYTKKGAIAVTQPRRVAAIMVATRVAYEQDVALGQEVGYSVRFDDKSSSKTKIKFLTDGMLVRELMLDSTLKRYSVVVLDEAHERSLNTEILFALIKRLQKSRSSTPNPLKVVVMSATLEAEVYANFFLNSQVLHVAGRRFPVQVLYTTEPQPDILDATVTSVLQIHLEQPKGDILVFLCGQDQIEDAAKVLRERGRALPPSADKLLPCPLYAAMPPAQQLMAFEKAPEGTRKVILATNIAESSITIEGILYVVDAGLVKARIYEPKMDMDLLQEMPVSKAQALQRTGRAGRMSAGKCFRLYQEDAYEELSQSAVPEIKRTRLSSMVLQLLVIGVDNLIEFDFMDPPPPNLLKKGLEELNLLGAIDAKMALTDLGKRMSLLPLEPQYAKLLLSSADFGCTEEILTVVAMVSVETIFHTPSTAREDAERARSHLVSQDGDHVTYLQVYNEWIKNKRSSEWCKQTFVNNKSMQRVYDVRKQLKDYCVQANIEMKSCGQHDFTSVCRCLVTALFGNAARLAPDGYAYRLETTAQKVLIHPTSSLFQRKAECVVFDQLLFTKKLYMRHCTVIDAEWLAELVPHMYKVRKPAPPGAKHLNA